MFQNRCLALAALMIALSFAAFRAAAQTVDNRSSLSPDSSITETAAFSPATPVNLPDAPSAAQQQPPAGGPQTTATPAAQQNSAPATSEEQLKQQEHQRVFGVMAAFNTTLNRDAPPLTPGQKFQLFFKSQTDPWPFGLAAFVAGYEQATDSPTEYGQGFQGYAKRFGASYGDAFIGNFWGNAVLPIMLHEDPRYFQKGTGSFASRFLWASTSTVWCRRDNGTWGPNYSNVIGNLIGASIANVYYPASERTVTDTITRGMTVTAEGIVGSEVIEFWPDIVRHYKRKHAEKAARKAAEHDGSSPDLHTKPSSPDTAAP